MWSLGLSILNCNYTIYIYIESRCTWNSMPYHRNRGVHQLTWPQVWGFMIVYMLTVEGATRRQVQYPQCCQRRAGSPRMQE